MNNTAKKQAPDTSAVEQLHRVSQQDAIAELHDHTLAFSDAVAEALGEFFDASAQRVNDVSVQKGYRASGNVHFSVPFSGLVNGEYIINLDEAVAAQLTECDTPSEDDDGETQSEIREEIAAAMCELLNTAVGTVIGDLGERYPHLSFASPRISYGQRVYPLIRFGHADLRTDSGELRCHFYVDHMELDLATSYAKVRASEEKARAALSAHMDMIERILGAINTGIFWVNPDGSLRARYSAASLALLGIDAEQMRGDVSSLVQAHATEPQPEEALKSWIQKAFEPASPEEWAARVYPDCPLRASIARGGQELRWRWLPVRSEGQDTPCALLVAVEDLALATSSARGSSSDLVEQLAMSEWSVADKG